MQQQQHAQLPQNYPRPGGDALRRRRRCRQSGFNFVEVLFAVMILGIGAIMLAAMFPVAISQTQLTQGETIGYTVVQGGANYMKQQTAWSMAGTGQVYPLDPVDYDRIKGEVICAADPRFAWVPMYRRQVDPLTGQAYPFAQVFLIGVQARATPTFTAADLTQETTAPFRANLRPRQVRLKRVTSDGNGPAIDQNVTIDTSAGLPAGMAANANAVAENCYVIIARDNQPGANAGRMNGRVYRIGNRRTDLDGTDVVGWEFMPGFEFVLDPDPDGAGPQTAIEGLEDADAYVIGRAYVGNGNFEGPAQDVAYYSTLISVPSTQPTTQP